MARRTVQYQALALAWAEPPPPSETPTVTGILCFPDPQHRDLAVQFVNGQGKSFDPAANAWADNPANPRTPLTKVLATNLANFQVAVYALPPAVGPVLAFIVPAAGGAPVDEPFPVVTADNVTPFGVAFAF